MPLRVCVHAGQTPGGISHAWRLTQRLVKFRDGACDACRESRCYREPAVGYTAPCLQSWVSGDHTEGEGDLCVAWADGGDSIQVISADGHHRSGCHNVRAASPHLSRAARRAFSDGCKDLEGGVRGPGWCLPAAGNCEHAGIAGHCTSSSRQTQHNQQVA